MARATATVMADGNATEMVATMVDGDRSGNDRWQRQWQWAIVTATAMAMASESATATEMATAMAMAMVMARATITKEGLPLHVAAMYSAFGGATPCLNPHGHKGKCMHHGGDTAKSVCSPLRERVPDSSPWIVFCLFFTTSVQFTEQPSVRPPALSRCSRTLPAD
jgi:hypothetical protein